MTWLLAAAACLLLWTLPICVFTCHNGAGDGGRSGVCVWSRDLFVTGLLPAHISRDFDGEEREEEVLEAGGTGLHEGWEALDAPLLDGCVCGGGEMKGCGEETDLKSG